MEDSSSMPNVHASARRCKRLSQTLQETRHFTSPLFERAVVVFWDLNKEYRDPRNTQTPAVKKGWDLQRTLHEHCSACQRQDVFNS